MRGFFWAGPLALSVWLFRILRNRQCQLSGCEHFALMTAFCHFGHGIFRSGQPKVHLSRFRESGVLGMTAELCRAVPMVLSRCDDAHAQLRSRWEGNATARKWLLP